jgi:hypothetical protein
MVASGALKKSISWILSMEMFTSPDGSLLHGASLR